MSKKINLKSDLILSKKFTTELSGYNAKEVDSFLDEILSDYRVFEEKINLLENKLLNNNQLLLDKAEEVEELKLEIETLKTQLKKTEEVSTNTLKKEIEEIKKKMNKI